MKNKKNMAERNSSLTDLPKPNRLQLGFESYLSPSSYRYGTDAMRKVWSQRNFWLTVRDVWIATATVQAQVGLVTSGQLEDLKAHRDDISVERIWQFERDRELGTGHDVAAAIAEYSEVAPIGGAILHQGLTSEDVLSNAEARLIRDSFGLVRSEMVGLLKAFGEKANDYKDLACIGVTHWQAAEPTTVGYRFARYAQNLLDDLSKLDLLLPSIKGKGIKGPVGTYGSIVNILKGRGLTAAEHERRIMELVGIPYAAISGQTYPRKATFTTEEILSSTGATLHQFGFDIQFLQSSFVNEVSEPRRKGQIGSSAMPHKQNPVNSENANALTEVLPGALLASWMTTAFDSLERTLRDSGGKRLWLPESFLIIDEALVKTERVVRGLVIHENAVRANLQRFAPFCATEIILGRLVEAGMDRKRAHEILVEHSETASDAIREGKPNPMQELIMADTRVSDLLPSNIIESSFQEVFRHTGDAAKKSASIARKTRHL